MRELAQKQNPSQPGASASLARSQQVATESRINAHSALHLQCRLSNQTNPASDHSEYISAVASAAPPQFGHNFSRIPVHSPVEPVVQRKQAAAEEEDEEQELPNHDSLSVQAKLKIGESNDKYEQEADRIADRVMRMPDHVAVAEQAPAARTNNQNILQRQKMEDKEEELMPFSAEELERAKRYKEAEEFTPLMESVATRDAAELEQEEEIVQPKRNTDQVPQVTPAFARNLHAIKGGGQTLSVSERAFFEPRFGRDFGQVRVHADGRAAQAARLIQARAFTLGNNVVFGAGEYSPGTLTGRSLLAHELTHVIQQTDTEPGSRVAAVPGKTQGVAVTSLARTMPQAHGMIQSQSLGADAICKKLPGLQVPAVYTSGVKVKGGGAASWSHLLGPFRCDSPRYAIQQQGGRLVGSAGSSVIQSHITGLRSSAASDKLIIEWIYNTYLKTVTASTDYKDFRIKLRQFAKSKLSAASAAGGSAAPKSGSTVQVAAETTAFITDVVGEWHKLGEIKPPSGPNPFENWTSQLHEQHHRQTILTHPQIKQASATLPGLKQALMSDPKLVHYAPMIRVIPEDHIPALVAHVYQSLHQERIKLRNQIRRMRQAGMPYSRYRHLVRKHNRALNDELAYRVHKKKLEMALQPRYQKYEQWAQRARNFAMEDLKAYCLSWQALRNVIRFIRRCIKSARTGRP